MQSWEVEFADFCKTMWFRNCVERSDWKEEPLDYDKYVEDNLEFIRKANMRGELDNILKSISNELRSKFTK